MSEAVGVANILKCMGFLGLLLVSSHQGVAAEAGRDDAQAGSVAGPVARPVSERGKIGEEDFQEKKLPTGGAAALRAERVFALPGSSWQTRFGGTSVVVLTRKPLAGERDQYHAICKAWINNFLSIGVGRDPLVLPWETDRIMAVFWPLDTAYPDEGKLGNCDYLIDHYDFKVGQQAADSVEASQGPLLVAWRRIDPGRKASLSLRSLSSERSISDAFEVWRYRIQLQPESWLDTLDITVLRGALRDFLNRNSDVLLCLVGSREGRQCVKGGV
ncbi:hypothetical protein J2847_003939 [Azospirillum agricola]|uniref:hypothetical protein n=1 Tax=Azospirillum agricola TaxID=1720247 RepID=UPI001AEAD003|nr:hypothetical protein [Azospirillum agricola]MBP2230634.1 hypothetical protein [Azospirillum agricola]